MYGILTLCDVDGGFLGTNYKILYTFLSHTRFTAENFSFCDVISGSAAVVSRSAANIVQFCCWDLDCCFKDLAFQWWFVMGLRLRLLILRSWALMLRSGFRCWNPKFWFLRFWLPILQTYVLIRSPELPWSSALKIKSSCGGVSSSATGILSLGTASAEISSSAIQVLRSATETLLRSWVFPWFSVPLLKMLSPGVNISSFGTRILSSMRRSYGLIVDLEFCCYNPKLWS